LYILFFVLAIVGILYKRYEYKRLKEEHLYEYDAIQKYLLDGVTLGKSKKPILWIHIPYEYNSRHWLNFGSRSSLELNQPYLYLTVRSIIKNCDESFTICIIDDSSFQKLLPNWNVNMKTISDPILSNMRMLGISKLLYVYGGVNCPISFLCFKDLHSLYQKGTSHNKMFVCETIDRNITSNELDFYPNVSFYGAPKENEQMRELCNFIQRIISYDYTADTTFLGTFDKWVMRKIHNGKINLIEGSEIGTKTVDGEQILIDDLMSNYYLNLCSNTYGILIPANDILNRNKFEWFARMSQKQVLESNTIIGNYMLLSVSPEKGILEPLEPSINKEVENKFVGFWRAPLQDVYGLKQIYVSDNTTKEKYPRR
jgi:hypothetical protein